MPADLEITKNTTNAEIAKELYGGRWLDRLVVYTQQMDVSR